MSDFGEMEEDFLKANALLREAGKLFGGSYSESNGMGWHLKQMTGLFKAVRDLLPMQEGSRVVLVKAPECEGGWARSKHFLVVGAVATVKSIDFYDGKFGAYLEFDNETWFDHHGKEHPPSRKHVYGFDLEDFKVIDKQPKIENAA